MTFSTMIGFRSMVWLPACVCVILSISTLTVVFADGPEKNPTTGAFTWGASLPESQGLSTERLYAARDVLAEHATHELLVVRNDHIVLEWYAKGFHPRMFYNGASLSKSLVGGLSLALALSDGRLQLDDPVCKYVPEWKNHPLKSKITIGQLASHMSGIANAEHIPTGWEGAFWGGEHNPFVTARDDAPVKWTPGSECQYSNPGMAMLSYAITASYQGTAYPDIRTLLGERICTPLGIPKDEWRLGGLKEQDYETNGLKLVVNWSGARFTARGTASIGRLMMRQGNWQGRQLIDSAWVERVVHYQGSPLGERSEKQPVPAVAYGWYNNLDGAWPKAPRDTFCGAGSGERTLILIPSLNMILVRYGSNMYDPAKGEGFWYGIEQYLVNPVMEALIE